MILLEKGVIIIIINMFSKNEKLVFEAQITEGINLWIISIGAQFLLAHFEI